MIEFVIEINGTKEEINWFKNNYANLIKEATPKKERSTIFTYPSANFFTIVVHSNLNLHYEEIIKEIKNKVPNCNYKGTVKLIKSFYNDNGLTKYDYSTQFNEND